MNTKLVKEISIDNDVLKNLMIEKYNEMLSDFISKVYHCLAEFKISGILRLEGNLFIDYKHSCLLPKVILKDSITSLTDKEIEGYYGSGFKWSKIPTDMTFTMYQSIGGFKYAYAKGKSADTVGGTLSVMLYSPLEFEISKADFDTITQFLLKNQLIPIDIEVKEFMSIYSHLNTSVPIEDALISMPDEKILKLVNVFGFDDEFIEDMLLTSDTKRAGHQPYNKRILDDANEGHWDLWDGTTKEANIKIPLSRRMYGKDPAACINQGVVGIDFGTKSTVVVYQVDSKKTIPMRIGLKDLSKKVMKSHYENPTCMQFIDFKNFWKDYIAQQCRPYTKWDDLTVSHQALNSMRDGSSSDDYSSFFANLKQWAGTQGDKHKIVDTKGYIIDLPEYIEVADIDPIEIYAYYLGLNINNLKNGIFIEYYLSFPVNYDMKSREKIRSSFYKGIKKSLPQTLLDNDEVMDSFEVHMGASEPAAYAVTALQEYGFEPEDEEVVAFGIFDFGGGTTDFDFGIWREASGAKERRYDYVIEHFGAGGDKTLGGENILNLISYEIVKKNADIIRNLGLVFSKPSECIEFIGSENILSNSREAKLNTRLLSEFMRPIWERSADVSKWGQSIKLNLFSNNGTYLSGISLTIDVEEIEKLIQNRIEIGVKNFFESIRLAFSNNFEILKDVEKINIFLAGNSSKSEVLQNMIYYYTLEESKKILGKEEIEVEENKFNIFLPLGYSKSEDVEEESENFEKPTGKTGVAFGLVECRKGSKIKIIDKNVGEDIKFKFYLGEIRKRKFKTVVDREHHYNKWIEFIDASEKEFEVFYSESPQASSNSMVMEDTSIKVKRLNIDVIDDEAMVYLRLIKPTEFEYVVAHESDIQNEKYMGDVRKVRLT